MKKTLAIMALAGMSGMAMAQTDNGGLKSVATNSFGSNWFIQAGVGLNSFYDNGERNDDVEYSKNPFKGYRMNPGLTFSIGKWFTPGIGLRTKLDGVWGKIITTRLPKEDKDYRYLMLNEQVLFNMSNLLYGYKESRTWNFIPYLGMGGVRNFTKNRYGLVFSAGFLNTWRLNDKLGLFFDLGAAMGGKDDFTGMFYTSKSSGFRTHDIVLNAQVGVSVNLGKNRFKAAPDVDAIQSNFRSQMDDMNRRLKETEDENARLKQQLSEPAPSAEKTTKEVVSTEYSVFFPLNSARISSRKDILNLQSVADYAKSNNSVVVIADGYADSKTGSASYNEQLSHRRAEAVADKLVELGVQRSQIQTNAKGGSNEVTPYKYNRRVIVRVK